MRWFLLMSLALGSVNLLAANSFSTDFEREKKIIKSMQGCHVVDYSYSETEVLSSDYQLDPRVYDVSAFTTKELIKIVDETPTSIRLQRFMMAEDKEGRVIIKMRHHGEVWEYAPNYLYEYLGRFNKNFDRWDILDISSMKGHWVRKTMSLDDGIRYQCAGKWIKEGPAKSFSCSSYAPIPGRETRDMGRRDYNTMERATKVVVYESSWLERQDNIKILFKNGLKKYLAREKGKIWSVKQKMSECAALNAWIEKRTPFWDILADVWSGILNGDRAFHEIRKIRGNSRSSRISGVLKDHLDDDLRNNTALRILVRKKLSSIIEAHRE